ncbi:unnamed protein product [Tenebrio molitor]|nr:unnamed protein product [Tenebrio molitor]
MVYYYNFTVLTVSFFTSIFFIKCRPPNLHVSQPSLTDKQQYQRHHHPTNN